MRYGFILAILSCLNPSASNSQNLFEVAFPNLTFDQPVDLQHPPDGSNRLMVVEQAGAIQVFDNHPNVMAMNLFLDISDRIVSGGERGLLGLAFHPDYVNNGYFYVNYTKAGTGGTVVSRFEVSAGNPDSASLDSEFIILEVEQPFSNHNGGQIVFGPDGYLYIGMGDGGSGGDPYGHGQNLATLLGALLRIDVDQPMNDANYGIPADNPFAGNTDGYREEIYAYGLRNPWRFSFDLVTGRLWLADVGQNKFEEIDIISSGQNYGWDIMEGMHCYDPPAACDTTGLSMPIWEYDRNAGWSITGGFVYRGTRAPALVGKYIYADWGSGKVWSLAYDEGNGPVNNEIAQLGPGSVTSFGVDEDGELYLCSFNGKIYHLAEALGVKEGNSLPESVALHQNYPNPFNPATTINFDLTETMDVVLIIYDQLGREVVGLVNRRFEAGHHQVVWDGYDASGGKVSNGIYIAGIKTPGFTRSIKMLLLK